MFDLRFFDAGFAATSMAVEAVSEAGRAFVVQHFGEAAVGAVLRKSGAYAMLDAAASAGLKVTVEDGPMPARFAS